jgi:DeoR family deoxyribose operon repressor
MPVGTLAKQCGVSEMTMRRDLRTLAKDGKINMVYGGATYVRSENEPGSYFLNNEKNKNPVKKEGIAMAAASLVQPHDVILLDSGSTIECMTHYLSDDAPYTILCYSLNIFDSVLPMMKSRIVLAGGTFHRGSSILTGSDAITTLQRYRINKFFFGAGGMHLKMSVTCNSEEAVPIKRAMFANSLEKILLLDSSKFERVTSYHLADLGEITMVITDDGIPEEYADYIRSHGVLIIAESKKQGVVPL